MDCTVINSSGVTDFLFSFIQHDEMGGDGNEFQTMTPGQKIRTCKKKLSGYESQVGQLKASR